MTLLKRFSWVFLLVVSLGAIGAPQDARAQAIQCNTPAEKAACQAQLDQVNAEIAQVQAQLKATQAESASLSRDIAILDAKIKAAQLDIKAKNLLIQTLGNDITQKQSHINDLEDRIGMGKETLAQLLRKTNEIDAYSMPQILLSQSTVSGFFSDVDEFQAVQESLKDRFEQLRSDQSETAAEKTALDKRRSTEIDARYEIQQQEDSIKASQTQRKQLLAVSKGNEKTYTAIASEKAARAAQIRAALFPLAGGTEIQFGQAVQYANAASQKTGVRPAFLLAVLTQESALGKNVGSCYLADPSTGAGISTKTNAAIANVMKPTRDVEPFMQITKSLGLDPMRTVVSCPQSVGYGGAMGPAQFIASTWVLFEDRLRAALGISDTPNPWNASHAFMASALYLDDLGAGVGGYTAERNAACRYFSGSVCSKSSLIASYGNSVVSKADGIQQTLNQL